MSDVTKPAKQTTSHKEACNRESLVPGVPVDFILEAIRRIDQEIAKLDGEVDVSGGVDGCQRGRYSNACLRCDK